MYLVNYKRICYNKTIYHNKLHDYRLHNNEIIPVKNKTGYSIILLCYKITRLICYNMMVALILKTIERMIIILSKVEGGAKYDYCKIKYANIFSNHQ